MNIVDLFSSAVKELKTFEKHPLQEASLEDQISYLNMLALMANVDDEIHESEQDYLQCLIKYFGLDASSLDGVIEYAKAPDKESIQAFIKNFKQTLFAEVFLFDALMVMNSDEQVKKSEQELFKQMKVGLSLPLKKQRLILSIYKYIREENTFEIEKLIQVQVIDRQAFEHIAKYFELKIKYPAKRKAK